MMVSFYTLGIIAFGLLTRGVVPCALLCLLQYILCKKGSPRHPQLGWILPILFAGLSLMALTPFVRSIVLGSAVSVPQVIANGLVIFVMYNIPTVIYLAIYLVTRKNSIKQRDMEKMNIQDLE